MCLGLCSWWGRQLRYRSMLHAVVQCRGPGYSVVFCDAQPSCSCLDLQFLIMVWCLVFNYVFCFPRKLLFTTSDTQYVRAKGVVVSQFLCFQHVVRHQRRYVFECAWCLSMIMSFVMYQTCSDADNKFVLWCKLVTLGIYIKAFLFDIVFCIKDWSLKSIEQVS